MLQQDPSVAFLDASVNLSRQVKPVIEFRSCHAVSGKKPKDIKTIVVGLIFKDIRLYGI